MTDTPKPTLAEPLDRTFVLSETFNDHVRDHPDIAADAFLAEQAAYISGLLQGFYSAIGQKAL